jgi:hypothetical protein
MTRAPKLIGVIIAAAVAEAHGQGAVEKPSYSAGDRWTYRSVDLRSNEETGSYQQRVTRISGDECVFERITLSSRDAKAVGRTELQKYDAAKGSVENPRAEGRFVALSFPMEPGKNWKFEYNVTNSSGGIVHWQHSARVEGWEEVHVPAGTFRALKIVHDGGWVLVNEEFTGNTAIQTRWYSPEVKRVVKLDYWDRNSWGALFNHSVTELVSFELQK